MTFVIKFITFCIAVLIMSYSYSALSYQDVDKNIPGNGDPSFHFFGPGQEYNRPSTGVEKLIAGTCQDKHLIIRWKEVSAYTPGTPRLLWIEQISLNGKNIDTSSLNKFEKLFTPLLADGFNLGCRWSQSSEYDFLVNFKSQVYFEFAEYWACTLDGPLPRFSEFTWYFYVSEEKGVFNPYVWPSYRLGDNIPAFRGAALEEPEPGDFPDCAAYEETGFPLTLE